MLDLASVGESANQKSRSSPKAATDRATVALLNPLEHSGYRIADPRQDEYLFIKINHADQGVGLRRVDGSIDV